MSFQKHLNIRIRICDLALEFNLNSITYISLNVYLFCYVNGELGL